MLLEKKKTSMARLKFIIKVRCVTVIFFTIYSETNLSARSKVHRWNILMHQTFLFLLNLPRKQLED